MNAMWIFGTSALIAVGLAALVVACLWTSMRGVVAELCGSASHAKFWVVLAGICTMLVSLLGVLLALPSDPIWRSSAWHDTLVGLRAGIFGLLLSLAAIALVLMLSIFDHERGRRARGEPRPGPEADPSWMKPLPTPPRS